MNPPIASPQPVDFSPTGERVSAAPTTTHHKRWGWGLIVLWIYSLLAVTLLVLGCIAFAFLPASPPVSPQQEIRDTIIMGLALLPIAMFIVLVGVKNFKK